MYNCHNCVNSPPSDEFTVGRVDHWGFACVFGVGVAGMFGVWGSDLGEYHGVWYKVIRTNPGAGINIIQARIVTRYHRADDSHSAFAKPFHGNFTLTLTEIGGPVVG